jgi:LmbE family N-acetylglucosaminyl deacetylase
MRPGSASSAPLQLPPLAVLLALAGLLALLALLALAVAGGAPAAATGVNVGPSPLEPAATGGLATLDRALAKLATHKRVLVIGAHPDDEDTALLTLVSRGMGGEAAYLSLSRGEGGQNLIGPELGVGLGLIRSRELLAARAIDGGRQFFTRAYDFGYTLSLDETLGEWPKSVLVEDVVRVMRRFKPQVVVSIFPGVPSPTHGQHQAAGISAFAAYPLAGDPAAMPRLAAEGLAPWAPQALYRSAFFDRNAPALTLSTAAIDPWSGRSDYQLAMASRSMHRSQDMGRLQNLGPQETRVTWAAGGAGAGPKDLFAGIDTHLHAIADTVADAALRRRVAAELDEVEALAGRTREQLNPARLDQALPPLLQIVGHLRAAAALLPPAPAADLIAEKLQVAETGAAAAAGIALDATTDREALVAGDAFTVRAGLWNSGAAAVTAAAVELVAAPEVQAEALRGEARPAVAAGALATWDLKPAVPAAAPPSMAYFLRRPLTGSLYDWSAATPAERGEPFGPPVYTARFSFTVDGVPLTLEREVVHLHRDEVQGEVRRPLRIVPAVEVAVAEAMQVWPLSRRDAKQLTVVLTSHRRTPVRGRLELTPEPAAAGAAPAAPATPATPAVPPTGAGTAPAKGAGGGAPAWPPVEPRPFELPAAADDLGEPVAVTLTLRPPAGLAVGRYPFHLAAVLDDGARFDLAVPPIAYEHIAPTPFPHRAAIEVSAFDLKLPALRRVGYVRGASDRVPEFLRQAGVPLELLSPAELASGDLSRYDAIVVGSRAYESDPALARANSRLLAYVRGGGLMIVQYQQYPFIDGGFAPYKLEIARPHDRVTDETSPVKLLAPASPVFNTPNRIGDADWQGWLQERGLYFAHTWDPAYQPLLAMADPGGPEQRGGLLVASVGKGRYVYTGLALFRQLPGGVAGGYRLFANLLALR